MISVVVNPSFQHLQEFARQIPERFDSDGTLLYRKRNVVKIRMARCSIANATW